MKVLKMGFFSALVVFLCFFVVSCQSHPGLRQGTQEAIEEAFRVVYERFAPQLILDGAGSHVVVSGDTLARISLARYGDEHFYPLIMLASRDVVLDPDRIFPGMRLTVPDLQRNLDDARARAALRDFLREVAVIEEERGRPAFAQGLRDKANTL